MNRRERRAWGDRRNRRALPGSRDSRPVPHPLAMMRDEHGTPTEASPFVDEIARYLR
jgi:hypothetical protein